MKNVVIQNILFAGYIMDPQDQSHFDYTMNNFFDCTDGY